MVLHGVRSLSSSLPFLITLYTPSPDTPADSISQGVVWTLIRSAFVKPEVHSRSNTQLANPHATEPSHSRTNSDAGQTENTGFVVPDDTVVIQFTDSIFYPNASRGKRTATSEIKLVYDKISHQSLDHRERSWSVSAERKIEKLRRQLGIVPKEAPLAVVVWDFTAVSFLDVTAVLALGELKQDVRLHCGREVRFRIVGLSESVRERFMRAQWKLRDLYADGEDEDDDVVYPTLEKAVVHRDGVVMEGVTIGDEKNLKIG